MVFYFSGTGNSQRVAKEIAQRTGAPLYSIGQTLTQTAKQTFHSARPFVFVCPTYAWRIPRVVEDWITRHQFTGSQQVYFVMTCGGHTYCAVDYIKTLCKKKSWVLLGFAQVVMPENYIAMFDTPPPQEADRLLEQAHPVIEKIADSIAMQERLPAFSKKGWLFSHLVNPLFYKLFVSANGFHTTSACVACKECVDLCPLGNIGFSHHPYWKSDDNCTHCMACINGCPAQAIEYKHKTQEKPRYYRKDKTK